jgi:DnaJ-class molecular chaperone
MEDAPDDLIRAVYLALARKYHPDRNLTNPEAMRMMQLINIAYQNLSEPDKREAHDDWIKQQRPDPAAGKKAQDTEQLDPQTKKAREEAQAWITLAEKAEAEAKQAQDKFSSAATKAATAPEHDKAKWQALAAQADAAAKETRAKAAEARAKARAAAEKAGIGFTPQGVTEKRTHYAVLKLTTNAPIDVIRAAYKALAQKYASELQQSQPGTADFVQTLNEAYKVLSDAEKKAQYDKELNLNKPQETKENAPLTMRPPTDREKELMAAAERAQAVAKAKLAMAERAQEEAREAGERAQQATAAAIQKAQEKDAPKWKAWAEKVTADAQAAKARAQKAVAEAEAAKQSAKETTARAAAEKAQADKLAASDAADAAQIRAIREAAERAEREKQG